EIDKPKSNNVVGSSVVNMVEDNNSTRYNDNKGKRKHHDSTKADPRQVKIELLEVWTDFASWQQHIRLYCQCKENGVNNLKSIDAGPFQMGDVREPLAEGTEGAPHLGPERPRVYFDLSPEEKDRYNADIWATNILLQGLPKDIYTLINHYIDAKDIWDNVKMLPEGSKLTKEYRESQLSQGTNPRGRGAAGYGGVQNRVGNANQGQARQVKCYNYIGIRHIARNCTQPKHPHNSDYYKDEMLLMQAHENGVAFDEEQLLLLAGRQDTAIDEDVDEQPVQDLALNVDNVFQADDRDAFDFDVDEAPTAQTMFIANPLFANPIDDEAEPSYDSDILSKVAIGYKNPFFLTRAKQVQPTLYNGHEIMRDNHVSAIVHNTEDTLEIAKITRRKMIDIMKDPECVTHKVKIAPHDYSKENFLVTFTTQKKLTPEQIFWSQDLIKLKSKALREQTTVSRSIKALTVYPPNTPATLVPRVLPMKSQVKIHIFTLIQLFPEFDKTCKKRITPIGITKGERGFEQTKECYLKEVIPFFKTLKENFKGIQKALTKEIKDVFDELEAEVAQNVVDRKHDEIKRKNLLIVNDNLIAECLSKEVFFVATNYELNVARFTKMHVANTIVEARCLELEAELSNLRNKSHNDNHDELVNRFSNLEIDEALDYRVKEFKVNRMNPGLNTRFWISKDVDRSKEFIFAIQKWLKTRRFFRNLESFIGGRVKDGDYRLLNDGTLHHIDEALDYRVKEFKVNRMNPGLNTRFWTSKDVDRSKEFIFAIQKWLKTRRFFRNLESFVGGRVRDGDYRLLKCTE
nr:zinc finger, CCHC-type [Tanacetum cinerariifolium]